MTPLTFTILVASICCVLFSSKRVAALGFLLGTLYLHQSQNLVVGGFLLYPTRILGLAAIIRILSRGELRSTQLTPVDSALCLLYGYVTFILILRPDESIPLRIAKAADVIFCYFSFRVFISSLDDLRWLLRAVAMLLIPYVCILAVESFTASKPFAIFGSNHSLWMREGTPRCFGTFRHPSILGSLGATFFPLFVALFWARNTRALAVLGAALCTAVVLFSNSGGPISAFAMAIVGWLIWPLRDRMQTVRRCLAAFIILMAVLMKAPIWYLLAKLSSVTGGTGWHRAYLMDVAFRHLEKWWLVGIPTSETYGWFPYNLGATGGADITNQYISFGLNGGLLAIVLFILVIVRAFRLIGAARAAAAESPLDEKLLWATGVVLAVHCVNWFGITYWDQFYVVHLAQLGAAVSVAQACLKNNIATDAVPAAVEQFGQDSAPTSTASLCLNIQPEKS